MFEFRVTKYDPAHRDDGGAYRRDEWTSAGDVGGSFRGVVLTREEYQRVERAYATVAVAFLREAGVRSLRVSGLENHAAVPLSFADGSVLSLRAAGHVMRRVLRGQFWCRLEGEEGFVHLGYDYYLYVGVRRPCPAAEALARRSGLFVETCRSPYRVAGGAESSLADGNECGPRP